MKKGFTNLCKTSKGKKCRQKSNDNRISETSTPGLLRKVAYPTYNNVTIYILKKIYTPNTHAASYESYCCSLRLLSMVDKTAPGIAWVATNSEVPRFKSAP